MCPCVAEYFLKCLPKLHPRRHYCLFLPVSSAEGGAVLIHQRSRTLAPRFLACFAGRPLAIRTRKTLLFTRAIRKTASSTLSAASQLIFAHKVALPSYLFVSRFSCEHEICPQTVRVNCNRKINAAFGVACFSFVLIISGIARHDNRYLFSNQERHAVQKLLGTTINRQLFYANAAQCSSRTA